MDQVSVSYVGQYYKMDPQIEDLIRGSDLKNGMEVLSAEIQDKVPLDEWTQTNAETFREHLNSLPAHTRHKADKNNRWMIVSDIQKTKYSIGYSFIGTYADGTKMLHDTSALQVWYVKKASIPEVPIPLVNLDTDLDTAIYETVKEALLRFDAKKYHGAPIDVLGDVNVLVEKIQKLLKHYPLDHEIVRIENLEGRIRKIIGDVVTETTKILMDVDENKGLEKGDIQRRTLGILNDGTNNVLEIFGAIPELSDEDKKNIEDLKPIQKPRREARLYHEGADGCGAVENKNGIVHIHRGNCPQNTSGTGETLK